MNLPGKVVVITGAKGGICAALVKALHEKGAKIYALDNSPNIPYVIPGVHYLSVDLTSSTETAAAMHHIKDKVDIAF